MREWKPSSFRSLACAAAAAASYLRNTAALHHSASSAPLWYFPRILLLWRHSFPVILCFFLRCFPIFHLLMSRWSPFYVFCGATGLSRFNIHTGGKRQQCPFGSFLMRLSFDTVLLWLFFSPLIARNPTSAELWLIFFCFPLRNGNTKPRNSLERGRALWLPCSTVHISGPDEAENMNIWGQPSTARRGLPLRPSPLKPSEGIISVCQCSRRGGRRVRWAGLGWGVLSWFSQLVVSAINQQWSGITGVVVRPRFAATSLASLWLPSG